MPMASLKWIHEPILEKDTQEGEKEVFALALHFFKNLPIGPDSLA